MLAHLHISPLAKSQASELGEASADVPFSNMADKSQAPVCQRPWIESR